MQARTASTRHGIPIISCAVRPAILTPGSALCSDTALIANQSDEMNPDEMRFVQAVSAKPSKLARKTTELDPDNAAYWHELATTARLPGTPNWRIKPSGRRCRWTKRILVSTTGVSGCCTPKWGGDPTKLKKVATLTLPAKFRYGSGHERMWNALRDAGFDALSNSSCCAP